MDLEEIAELRVVGKSEGMDKVKSDIEGVAKAQGDLANQSGITATVTETVAKKHLDASAAYDKLHLSLDAAAGSTAAFEKRQSIINTALAQGHITQAQAAADIELLSQRYLSGGKSVSALNAILDAGRGAALGYAAGIGPIGAVLGSFGPWGIAAAAGIGLVTNALGYMNAKATEIGAESSGLKQFADTTGLTITQVRGLNDAGGSLGVSADQMASAVQKFTLNLGDARKGGGDLYDQLRIIDKQLAEDVSNTRDGAQALDLLTKAYNSTTDATARAAIARAAFGKGGGSVGPVLGVVGDAGGVDAYSASVAKALGVTDEWTNKVRALHNENRSLEGDLKLIEASVYTEATLERQNRFLKTQIEIAKFARDAASLPGGATSQQRNPFVQETNRSAGIEPRTYAQGGDPVVDSGPISAAKTATEGLAQARLNALDAATKMAAGSSALVSALGSSATAAEKEQARIDALTVSFDAAKISEETYNRALAANPAITAAQQTTDQMRQQNDLAAAGIVHLSGKTDLQKAEAQQQATYSQQRIAYQQEYDRVLKETGSGITAINAANEKWRSYEVAIAAGQDRINDAQKSAHESALAWQADMLGISDKAKAMADESVRAAEAFENAARAASDASKQFGGDSQSSAFGNFGGSKETATSGGQFSSVIDTVGQWARTLIAQTSDQLANSKLGGGINSSLAAVQRQPTGQVGLTGMSYAATDQSKISTLQSLYDLKNAQTDDKSVKLANDQAFMAFLQKQPETIARDQKIVELYNAMKQLTNATDANTAATAATLNPLYSQGHGALAIGYYKAAGGLDMMAHGPSSGDTVPFHAMVNGGERIRITPPGQSGNDNRPPAPQTTIVQHFDFSGVKTSNARRSRRQFAQGFSQTAAAMS